MSTTQNYVQAYLPTEVIKELEAGAYESLCQHLRDRSDEVQNIDMMTVSGFCRNCLAKWLVVEARKLSDAVKAGTKTLDDADQVVQSLDALGYDEAAQYVYGMAYGDWKKIHSRKASDETMEKYNASKPIWSTYDKQQLEKRSETPGGALQGKSTPEASQGGSPPSLLSNVCCQDVDQPAASQETKKAAPKKSREVPPFVPPPLPDVTFSLGILTVSDRASTGEYKTGDLSGPAVAAAVDAVLTSNNAKATKSSVVTAIVPDNIGQIQSKLKEWSDDSKLSLVFTTGGTGFSSRDVTPEATNGIVDRVCDGLVAFCTLESARIQPLASLSRGSAGVRGKTLVVNLPGNPKAVGEIMPILLPLALHAVSDLSY
eukprot:Nitzschia sp. Nitz4//scaffold176_size46146//1688//2859//NITZ4_007186-RA/size46146-snap-gene-0.2-mRNA-1//-1//CDS//3329538997//6112//frame0